MRLVLTRVEAKILYAYLKGKRISSVREYIVLQDIMSRLEEITENETKDINSWADSWRAWHSA